MTLQELRYLVALADEGHFAHAAEACHVGQPTLSTQVKKLEEYLGVVLFDRSQRQVVPTRIGEDIVAQARLALMEVDKIRDLARSERDPMQGAFSLGVIPTLGPYLLPHLLPTIRATYPDLSLYLREDLTTNLLERLRLGKLDAVLMGLPIPAADGLKVSELFSEPFVVALPVRNALVEKSAVTQEDLREHCVLLLEDGHCLRDQALAICGTTMDHQREQVAATSLETLRQMVAAGVGVTLLPSLATQSGFGLINSGLVQIRSFAEPMPSRTVGLVWRQRFAREETVTRLAELIRGHLPALVSPVQ